MSVTSKDYVGERDIGLFIYNPFLPINCSEIIATDEVQERKRDREMDSLRKKERKRERDGDFIAA